MFRKFSRVTADLLGSPYAFVAAAVTVLAWALVGPIFDFSDTWQLAINTGTTIVTFLMVFLIQNTQNRDAVAVHLKLDELLRAVASARTGLVALEDLSDEDLARLKNQFALLSQHCGPLDPDKPPSERQEVSASESLAVEPPGG